MTPDATPARDLPLDRGKGRGGVRPPVPVQRRRPRQSAASARDLGAAGGAGLTGHAPILPRSFLRRVRLEEALDRATKDPGITLLVAPAGAGKTLGVAGWLRDSDR